MPGKLSGPELAAAYVSIALSTGGMGTALKKELGAAGDEGGRVGGERAGRSMLGSMGRVLRTGVKAIGLTAGVTVGALLGKGLADSFAQSDATTKFKQSLDFAGITKGQIDQATKLTQGYADKTVFDLSTVQNTAAQLAANGVKDFTGLTEAAGNLTAVAGGNADSFRSVAMAMTQTVGAGKLTTENWNQIADAIPGASGVLQEAMRKNGAFTGDFRDAMAKSQITAEEFNKALMEVGTRPIAVEAAKSTATFEGAMGNMMATITGGFAGLLNKVKPQLTGFITAASGLAQKGFEAVSKFASDIADRAPKMWAAMKVNPTVRSTLDKLGEIWATLRKTAIDLWPSIKEIGSSLAKASASVGVSTWGIFLALAKTLADALQKFLVPALKWIAKFMKDNPALVAATVAALTTYKIVSIAITKTTALWAAGQKLLNLAMKANPIGIVIAAVAALTAGFIYLWNNSEGFRNFWIGLWDKIKSAAAAVVDWFKSSVLPVVRPVFDTIGRLVGDVIGIFQGLWQFISGVFTGNWSGAWDGIKKIFGSWWDGIKAQVSLVVSFFGNMLGRIWDAITSGAAWLTGKAGELVGWILDGIKSTAATVWDWFTNLPATAWAGVVALVTTINGYGNDLMNWIWDGIKAAAGAVWTWFTNLPATAWAGIKALSAWIIARGSEFLNWIWGGIKSAATSVWTWFSELPGYLWNGFLSVAGATGSWLLAKGKQILNWIWDGVKSVASDVWNWFADIPNKIWTALKNMWQRLIDFGKEIINKIIAGIKATGSAIWDAITSLFTGSGKSVTIPVTVQATADSMKDVISGKTNNPLVDAMSKHYGGPNASGGPVDPSQFYLVGEQGPELFVPTQRGRIIPNHQIVGNGASSDDSAIVAELRELRAEFARLTVEYHRMPQRQITLAMNAGMKGYHL